jgi:hypothetical protein
LIASTDVWFCEERNGRNTVDRHAFPRLDSGLDPAPPSGSEGDHPLKGPAFHRLHLSTVTLFSHYPRATGLTEIIPGDRWGRRGKEREIGWRKGGVR